MTDTIEKRALNNLTDAAFDASIELSDDMQAFVQAACVSFAREELHTELSSLREMDMGSASDRIISRADELERLLYN